jgi:uncharacterized protein (TIGR02145 family)
MKRVFLSLSFLILIIALLYDPAKLIAAIKPESFLKRQDTKTGFIENKGQIIDQNNKPNPAVLYLLNTPGMNVQLRKGGFSYDLYEIRQEARGNGQEKGSRHQAIGNYVESDDWSHDHARHDSIINCQLSIINYHRIDIDLQNANPNPIVETSAPSSGYFNYYTMGTPVEGVISVRSYTTVIYKNIYPGIDLAFVENNDRHFEYNFILQPGADISSIKLKVYGPERIKSYREELRCETRLGDVDETIPVCYYTLNDNRIPVRGRFKKIMEHLYGFAVDQAIPAGAVLIIDPIPTRRWGTYYGGDGQEMVYEKGCATDHNGNIFICGYTNSETNIATAGAYQSFFTGFTDGFLAKFSTTGQRFWGTYYGGTHATEGYSCATDADGNIFLVGETAAYNYIATPGAYQTVLNGTEDAFIAKFTTDGLRLWGTYYGGHETGAPDELLACSADDSGNIYCAGITSSPDLISTPGAEQTTYGGGPTDVFLVKFTGDGQRVWGTYYGGTSDEYDASCSIGSNGYLYLSGSTHSTNNIATAGSFMPNYSGFGKAFLACFDLSGTRLWGTYFGGESFDDGFGCTADTLSNVYLFGATYSLTNISTPGVFLTTLTTSDGGYLEKFSSAGVRLWGTYYPSSIHGAAVDDSGFVFIAGITDQNPLISSPGAYQTVFRGLYDAFLGKMTGNGQRIWGTYYGGTDNDNGVSCVVDHNDNIYLFGNTYSDNNTDNNISPCTRNPLANYIASPGSLQPNYGGGWGGDGYLVKFADCWSPDTALQIIAPSFLCANSTGITFSIAPIATATDYTWCITGDLIITAGQHTTLITVEVGSTLGWDTISVYGINSCDTGFPKVITRRVKSRPNPLISGTDTTCTGTINLFTTAGGKANYQWTVSPGGTITLGGTATDSACSVSWNTGGAQWIKVNYTDTSGCAALNPTQFNVWVIAGPAASVTIVASSNNVCAGTSVTFTATPTNGGLTPGYQWQVNGVNSGTNSTVFTYIPSNGDVITCLLTSSLTGCISNNPALSNSILMIINSVLIVNISINPSSNPVCAGSSVTFTATPVNGGTAPSYQWKVNGINTGTNSPVYSYVPLNGDQVNCELTSSVDCPLTNPITSNTLLMTTNNSLPAGVSISASSNPFCPGSYVTFTATPTNGGSAPAYQWKINGANAGTNSSTFAYNPVNNDSVRCVMTSNLSCVTDNPASSAKIIMSGTLAPIVTFTSCFDTITTINAQPIKLKGGIPLGGTYSGPGVNSSTGIYTPVLAGIGTHTITYTYTNAAMCSALAHTHIINYPLSIVNCGNPITDIRDNKVYQTVQIGSQCWFASNLNYGTILASSQDQRDNCVAEKHCFNDNPANCTKQGGLYQWDELMQYDDTPADQGFCLPGWHIPTENEWNTLFANWTNNGFAGSPLKYSGYSGFNALLYGVNHFNRTWDFQGFATFFWSSTPRSSTQAWAHGLNEADPSVSLYPSSRVNAFSVRCLKD